MNTIEKLFKSAPSKEEFAEGYLTYLVDLLNRIDLTEISKFINIICQAQKRGARIFFIGNGGSAATASHFANDFSIGSRDWNNPIKAIALTDNVSILTAIANDYGYDDVFRLQLQCQAVTGDVVVAISASGNSRNLISAIQYANEEKMITVGLTGFDGGELKKHAQHSVHIECPSGEYGPVEDIHMVIDHLVGAYLMYK